MDKITYLAQLAEGLARWVPERERQDILRYYAEYFEEAGPEREAEVVAELGDPWALSSRLAVEGGYVTQEGARDWTPRQNRRKAWPWVLAGALVLVVALIGSAGMAFAQIARTMWRDHVIGYGEAVTGITVQEVEPDASIEALTPGDRGGAVTYFIEDEYAGGFWTMEDGYLEMFDSIDADISLGNITVTGADDYTLFINQSTTLGGYNLTWEVSGGTLKIRDSSGRNVDVNGFQNLFKGNSFALDISITVPEGVLLDKVTAKTGLGNVFVGDVYTEKVNAETGMGNIECYEVREAQKIDLSSGMGDVTLGIGELCSGVDIDLETGMGNVEASLGCVEAECEYELESGMGTVSVNGVSRGDEAGRKGSYPYKLDAESGMGDVRVFFYEDRW